MNDTRRLAAIIQAIQEGAGYLILVDNPTSTFVDCQADRHQLNRFLGLGEHLLIDLNREEILDAQTKYDRAIPKN